MEKGFKFLIVSFLIIGIFLTFISANSFGLNNPTLPKLISDSKTCSGTDKVFSIDFTENKIVCSTDQTGAGAIGNPFDQVLNITSSVSFGSVTLDGVLISTWNSLNETDLILSVNTTNNLQLLLNDTYLSINGDNANQNINIGIYNFTAGSYFGDGRFLTGIQHGALTLFLHDEASGVSGSKILDTADNDTSLVTLSESITFDGQEFQNFTSQIGVPGLPILSDGIYELHFHARVTGAGTQDTTLQFKLYKVNSTGGDEVLVVTSEESKILTTDFSQEEIHVFGNEMALGSNDRLLLQIIIGLSGGGSNPTVEIEIENGVESRIEIPSPSPTRELFIPYIGAVKNVDLGANNFTIDGSVFHVDINNNKVGVGTITPTVSLEVGDATEEEIIRVSSGVNGNAILSANSFLSTGNPLTQYIVAGGNNWVIGIDNADNDKFKISNHITDLGTNNFLTIQTDGKVGIGTSSPDSIFHIKANIAGNVGSHSAGQIIIQNPTDSVTSNVVITAYESDGSGNPDQQLWYLGSSSSSNSNIIFLNRRNALLQFGTNDNTQMTILGNGNVGIGLINPSTLLEVAGNINSTGGDICITGGNCLSSVGGSVADGSINSSAFNRTSGLIFSANLNDNLNITNGNITLGQRIKFGFGEIIDNIVDGTIRIVGNLNVTDTLILNPQIIPTTSIEGGLFYNSSLTSPMFYDGSDWLQFGQGVPRGAIVSFNSTCLSGWTETHESLRSKRDSAEAWVTFDGTDCSGTGNTCTIRDSFNIDNVTRTATGKYTIYWDRDFANSNYAYSVAIENNGDGIVEAGGYLSGSKTSGALGTFVLDSAHNFANAGSVSAIAFGEDTTSLTYCEKTSDDSLATAGLIGNSGSNTFLQNIAHFFGIGTTSPTHELNVVGNVNITGNVTIEGSIDESETPEKNTLYSEALPKAWVNFDGTSCSGTGGSCVTASCTIRGSFNVECVDRVATGDYVVYWDRDFADANYVVSYIRNYVSNANQYATFIDSQLVGSIHVRSWDAGASNSVMSQVIAFGRQ